ncbi:5586_t:CDS:2 [Funneliformis caledonium]|uniref:5586_t:CDS:1 n=1 Tax=Funneliformis caledonium TaxID=1117310 RepID=A0A9N9CMX2_9GLOM|nr:5586_t:CDS:2 [Funneliformis caledonium]
MSVCTLIPPIKLLDLVANENSDKCEAHHICDRDNKRVKRAVEILEQREV